MTPERHGNSANPSITTGRAFRKTTGPSVGKSHFKPLRVGRRFLIVPTWEDANPTVEDLVIRMDPGRAFGTGHHETTRLCLRWLEEWAEGRRDLRSRSVLDVGTGSGILAIAAALLGVDRATGVDNDPEAIEVARENIELNALSERVCAMEGSVGDVDGTFDAVLANIQANPLVEMATSLGDRVATGGRLVLSGVLIEQRESVLSAFERTGRRFLDMKTGRRMVPVWFLNDLERIGKNDPRCGRGYMDFLRGGRGAEDA